MEETVDESFRIKSFLNEFNSERISPSAEDAVQMRCGIVGNYSLKPEEVEGEVTDWALHYLEQRRCPYMLAVALAKTVAQQLSASAHEKASQSNGNSPHDEKNTLQEAAHLHLETINNLHELCNHWRDDPDKAETSVTSRALSLRYTASVCAIKNGRRKMEDRHVILHDLNAICGLQNVPPHSYFAVFDGHAGVDAASFAAAHLHTNIVQHPKFLTDTETAIKEAFQLTDLQFYDRSIRENIKSGCTVVNALIRDNTLYIAWLGDSQAILVKQGKPIAVMNPHKPEREDERKRIEDLGGCVLYIGTWRVNGTLAVSRALGDPEHKPYVSSEPEVTTIHLDGTEDFLVLACDGLWDRMTPSDVSVALYRHLTDNPRDTDSIAAKLVHQSKEQGSSDNITTIVIFLRDIPSLIASAPSYAAIFPQLQGLKRDNMQIVNGNAEKFNIEGELTGTTIIKPSNLDLSSGIPKNFPKEFDFPNSSKSYSNFYQNTSEAYDFNQVKYESAEGIPPEATALSELPTPPIDEIVASQQFAENPTTEQLLQFQSHLEAQGFQGVAFGESDLLVTTSEQSSSLNNQEVAENEKLTRAEAVELATDVVSNAIEIAVKHVTAIPNETEELQDSLAMSPDVINYTHEENTSVRFSSCLLDSSPVLVESTSFTHPSSRHVLNPFAEPFKMKIDFTAQNISEENIDSFIPFEAEQPSATRDEIKDIQPSSNSPFESIPPFVAPPVFHEEFPEHSALPASFAENIQASNREYDLPLVTDVQMPSAPSFELVMSEESHIGNTCNTSTELSLDTLSLEPIQSILPQENFPSNESANLLQMDVQTPNMQDSEEILILKDFAAIPSHEVPVDEAPKAELLNSPENSARSEPKHTSLVSERDKVLDESLSTSEMLHSLVEEVQKTEKKEQLVTTDVVEDVPSFFSGESFSEADTAQDQSKELFDDDTSDNSRSQLLSSLDNSAQSAACNLLYEKCILDESFQESVIPDLSKEPDFSLLPQESIVPSLQSEEPALSLHSQEPIPSLLSQELSPSLLSQEPPQSLLSQEPPQSLLSQEPPLSLLSQEPPLSLLSQEPPLSLLSEERPLGLLSQEPPPTSPQEPPPSLPSQEPSPTSPQEPPPSLPSQEPPPTSPQEPPPSLPSQEPPPTSPQELPPSLPSQEPPPTSPQEPPSSLLPQELVPSLLPEESLPSSLPQEPVSSLLPQEPVSSLLPPDPVPSFVGDVNKSSIAVNGEDVSKQVTEQVISKDSLLPEEVQAKLLEATTPTPSDSITEDLQLGGVAVDLQAIPDGVPEAEGVTEDVDSDSEKDGGWSYIKGAEPKKASEPKAPPSLQKSSDKKTSAQQSQTKAKKEPVKTATDVRNKSRLSGTVDKVKKPAGVVEKKTDVKERRDKPVTSTKSLLSQSAPSRPSSGAPVGTARKPMVSAIQRPTALKVSNTSSSSSVKASTSSVASRTSHPPLPKTQTIPKTFGKPLSSSTPAKTDVQKSVLPPGGSRTKPSTMRPASASAARTRDVSSQVSGTSKQGNTDSAQRLQIRPSSAPSTSKTTLASKGVLSSSKTSSSTLGGTTDTRPKAAPGTFRKPLTPSTSKTSSTKQDVKEVKDSVNKQISARKVMPSTSQARKAPTLPKADVALKKTAVSKAEEKTTKTSSATRSDISKSNVQNRVAKGKDTGKSSLVSKSQLLKQAKTAKEDASKNGPAKTVDPHLQDAPKSSPANTLQEINLPEEEKGALEANTRETASEDSSRLTPETPTDSRALETTNKDELNQIPETFDVL